MKTSLKGEFHVSVHRQTVTSAHLIPLLLKQLKEMMQETDTIPSKWNSSLELLLQSFPLCYNLLHANR